MVQQEVFPINIWVNEERYEELQKAGLAEMTEEVLAGMKRLRVPTNEQQRDAVLKRYPMAKYDSATTKSIELLPKEAKDKIFGLVVEKRSLEVIDDFLKSH